MNNLFTDTPYSETAGSFIRNGNYPLEANYIFPTEEALKEFYSDEVNITTIHKGLLKIVENDGTGKQALYWVTKKQTNDELEFTKLISGTNIDSIFSQLDDLETRLAEEIKNRKDSETAIWGTNDPTNVPEELNSLLDLATVIIALKKEVADIHKELIDSDDSIVASLKTEVKALAGTQEFSIVPYLQTLPYKNLTEVSNALNKFLNEVDNTSNQINTLPELKFFLEGYTDKQKLHQVLLDLKSDILGSPFPSEDFITLRAIEDFVRILKADSEHTDRNLQSELDRTQIGVGLSGDGSYNADKETYYLKDATSIMNALKILDALMYEAISGITIEAENNDVVDLAVRKELEGYIVSAKLKLSNQLGNDLLKKDDGLYFNVNSTYKNGTLSLYVNDKLVAQHVLGFSSLVDTAIYDPAQEAIVITFKLLNGEKQTISIPVGGLIREWQIDNSQPGKVVELERTTVVDGPDELSADIRLWSDKSNILRKYGNTLGVAGTSENITHNNETLKVFLDTLRTTIVNNNTTVNNKIDSEIARATAKEAELEAGISQVRSDLNTEVEDINDDITAVNNAVKAETNRATAEENAIRTQISDLKTADSEIRQVNETQNARISDLEKQLSDTNHSIELETQRATDAETQINQKITSIEGELTGISQRQTNLDSDLTKLDSKVDLQKEQLLQEIHLVSDDVEDMVATKADKSEVDAIKTKADDTAEKLSQEIVRATQKEGELQTSITTQIAEATGKINDNTAAIQALDASTSKELSKKIESVVLEKVSDLTFNLIVDGVNVGQINIPEDQFLESVTVVNGSTLRFVFKTKTGTTTTDINIEDIILEALSELEAKVNTKAPIDSPTFTGIPQVAQSPDEADSSQRIPSTNWVNARIAAEISKISTDMYYTKTEIQLMMAGKADLVDGKVPESQLPKLYIIEVE